MSVPSKWYSVRRELACAPPPVNAPETMSWGFSYQVVNLAVIVAYEEVKLVEEFR